VAILWPNGRTTPPPISSGFGPRGSGAYGDASTWHLGTDFYGYDTIHAIADGTVVYVGWNSGVGWSSVAGYMVWVQHDGFFSRSLHTAAATARVSVGDQVRAGDPLIDMGYSGLFDGAGNPAPWRKHHHLEITPGQWHAGNTGQVNPYTWLAEHVGGSATGAGGGGTEISNDTNQSEEDDMRYLKLKDNGRLYQVGPEFINGVDGADGENKAWADAGLPGYTEVARWSFDRILRHHAIPENVVNAAGDVLDDLTGGTRYVRHGSWSRAQKVERLAYVAGK